MMTTNRSPDLSRDSDQASIGTAPSRRINRRTILLMGAAGTLGVATLLPLTADAAEGQRVWKESKAKVDQIIHHRTAPPTTMACVGCGMG